MIARITGSLLQTLITKKHYCTALSKVSEVLMLGFTIKSTNLGDLRFPIITIYLSISTASTSQLYNQVAGAKSSSKPVTLSSHSGRCWPSGKYKPRWQALLYLMTTLLITHKLVKIVCLSCCILFDWNQRWKWGAQKSRRISRKRQLAISLDKLPVRSSCFGKVLHYQSQAVGESTESTEIQPLESIKT